MVGGSEMLIPGAARATIGHRHPRIPRRLLSSRAASVFAGVPRIARPAAESGHSRRCNAPVRISPFPALNADWGWFRADRRCGRALRVSLTGFCRRWRCSGPATRGCEAGSQVPGSPSVVLAVPSHELRHRSPPAAGRRCPGNEPAAAATSRTAWRSSPDPARPRMTAQSRPPPSTVRLGVVPGWGARLARDEKILCDRRVSRVSLQVGGNTMTWIRKLVKGTVPGS